MTKRIIRLPEVLRKTEQSKSTLYDRIKEGIFPTPIGLGGRNVGWLEDEIDGWIASCIKKSRMGKADE